MRRPAHDPADSDAGGYAMAVLLVAIAVMLTLMTVAMPVWRQQQKREREEELLFRLKQYAHALALYQRRLPGAAPANVDDLVKQRFLRKKYKDPITGKDFAILRVGQVSPGMTSPVPGLPQATPATSTRPGQPSGQSPPSAFGPRPGAGASGTPSPGVQPGGPGSQGMSTGAIRGVVSTSKDTSLRAWKGRTQYDQWEVAIEDITPRSFGAQIPQPGQNQGARPGAAGQSRPGPPRPGQAPPGSLPTNPYGGTIRP